MLAQALWGVTQWDHVYRGRKFYTVEKQSKMSQWVSWVTPTISRAVQISCCMSGFMRLEVQVVLCAFLHVEVNFLYRIKLCHCQFKYILIKNICTQNFVLAQGCPNSVLEGRCPAEFSSNPNQTHLKQLIKLLLGILEASMQVCWGKLELNSAGHRPSRTEFGQPWTSKSCSAYLYIIWIVCHSN